MSDRQPFLTKEFIQKNDIYFLPKSQDESGLVQEALFQLGCLWLSSGRDYFNTHANPIYVHDRVMTTDKPPKKAIFCTIDDFFSIPRLEEAVERTTKRAKEKTYQECLAEYFNIMVKKIDAQTHEIAGQRQEIAELRQEIAELRKRIDPPTDLFKK